MQMSDYPSLNLFFKVGPMLQLTPAYNKHDEAILSIPSKYMYALHFFTPVFLTSTVVIQFDE